MSSGTTGHPILNPYTAADIEQWGTVMARCYGAAGVAARDVVQITPSFGLFTGGFGFHYGAEPLGAVRPHHALAPRRDLRLGDVVRRAPGAHRARAPHPCLRHHRHDRDGGA